MQAVPKCQKYVVEQDLILVRATHNVDSNIRLHLVEHHLVVVEEDIAGLLCCLLEEALLKTELGSLIGIGVLGSARGSCRVRSSIWSASWQHATPEKGLKECLSHTESGGYS